MTHYVAQQRGPTDLLSSVVKRLVTGAEQMRVLQTTLP